MHVYLYLNEPSHAETWVNGGEIPINPASTYKKDDRKGIFTPDENLIHKSEMDMMGLGPGVFFDPAGSYRNITMIDCDFGAGPVNVTAADYYHDDGLILSFSRSLSREVMDRFENKKVCVKISSVDKLRKVLDKRLGCKSVYGDCKYTNDHQRNHFLKSVEDEWQQEYRMFWKAGVKTRWAKIPGGLAEVVTVPNYF